MTASFRRILATILLASYGLISACGAGLHVLAGDRHHEVAPENTSEEGRHAPSSPLSDNSDCSICHVIAQGQLQVDPEPRVAETLTVGLASPTALIEPRRLAHQNADPRGPPHARV